jgi:WD40 repeat protein
MQGTHASPETQPPLLLPCVQIWSVQTGLLLVSCRGHTTEVSDLALSCDGQLLASGASDGEVRVWSMKVSTRVRGALL